MSRSTLLLTFKGRKTGHSYTIPLVYYQQGAKLLLTTDSRWWHNLVDGAGVVVRLRGQDEPARADPDTDDHDVSTILQEMVRRYPRRYTRLATQHALPGAAQRVVVEITLPQQAPA